MSTRNTQIPHPSLCVVGCLVVSVEVTVFVWREGKWYVAFEPLTGVASQGRSVSEALGNLREALELYLEERDVELHPLHRVMITRLKVERK